MSIVESSVHVPAPVNVVRVRREIVSLAAPASPGAEQYRGLRHSIERLHRDAGTSLIAVTSAGPGDGKSVTTVNLAASLAQTAGARVLIIDADLHKATTEQYFGLPRDRGPGLGDALANPSLTLAEITRRLNGINVSAVFAGAARPHPYQLLGSPRLEALLTEARAQYDFVLLDTPPAVVVTDTRVLSRWVDGVLVVVAAHKTPRAMVADALRLLEGSRVLGLVFNGDDRPLRGYQEYYGARATAAATLSSPRRAAAPPIPKR